MNIELLSIIIAVYNTEKYLKRCIDSILSQSYHKIEIILVDDGSTDSSGKICDEFAKKYNNIHTYHKTNGGQATARNLGIEKSKGSYITFVDSDDYISNKNTYEYAIKCIINDSDIDIVQFPYKTYHDNPEKDYLFCSDEILRSKDGIKKLEDKREIITNLRAANHWKSGVISTALWDKVFKRECFENIRMKHMFLEDVVCIVDVLKQIDTIALIPKGEYAYCIRENSTLTSKWTYKKSCDELESILHVYEFVLENAPESEQSITTYLWIVSMLTSIRVRFNVNYLSANPNIKISQPKRTAKSHYNQLRMNLISTIGLKRYIDTVTIFKRLSYHE